MYLARRPALRLAMTLSVALLSLWAALPTGARAAGSLAPPASVRAPEALLIETDNGTVVAARRANRRVPIASTTKLMTAYVTLEYEPLGHTFIDRPYKATPDESLAGLTVGKRYNVADLLRAMLIPSGGDAANTLALGVGGGSIARFLALMNTAARQLGLTDTHYTTPVGLDTPGNYSTATDLAKLAEVLLRNAFFAKVVREPVAQLHSGLVVRNTDDLIGEYPFLVGVKTGHTADAGYCLVGAASWHGVHLLSVVLGDPSIAARDADTLALLREGLRRYHRVSIAVAGRTYATVRADGDSSEPVALVAAHSASLVVSRAVAFHVSLDGVPTTLNGPLAAGSEVGEIDATENGRTVLAVPLLTRLAVAAPRASSGTPYWIGALALIALGGCTLRVMRSRARQRARRRRRRVLE